MSFVEGEIELVGTPEKAGSSREGQAIELIAIMDDARTAAKASAGFAADQAPVVPNYYLDQSGHIRQFVADTRAGNGLALAIYQGHRRNLDRLSLCLRLERPAGTAYSFAQIEALHRLLTVLSAQYQLDDSALVTITTDAAGQARVVPHLPPGPSLNQILGAGLDPAQELFVSLYGETFKPFGGVLKLDRAFPLHAAKFNLGAPVSRDEPPPITVGGRSFSLQVFARDTIFNEGTNYAAVQQLSALSDPQRDEIPTAGLGRALLEATYRVSIKAAKTAGVTIKGRENLEPGWRFHQVAHNANYGPPLSGNYVSDNGKYAVQVFPGETLYTPLTDQSDCTYLSTTDPVDPAYTVIWRETYKVARAAYDPNAPLHKKALELKLGTPLTGPYSVTLGGTAYTMQVWAFDTLYQGPDGQIKRMNDLPKPPSVQAWRPAPVAKPVPPTPLNPLPPVAPPSSPRPNDINWPPRPNFGILSDTGGAREKALGHIAYVRASGDFVKITNGWDKQNLIDVKLPQLLKLPGVKISSVTFHRLAAGQLQRLWAAWEAAGLLRLIKSFDGSFAARTIRLKPTVLSNHAYGTAFDINAKWNGLMRIAPFVGQEGSVRELVPLANAHGFYWGGHWNYDGKGASDGMHFEWAKPV